MWWVGVGWWGLGWKEWVLIQLTPSQPSRFISVLNQSRNHNNKHKTQQKQQRQERQQLVEKQRGKKKRRKGTKGLADSGEIPTKLTGSLPLSFTEDRDSIRPVTTKTWDLDQSLQSSGSLHHWTQHCGYLSLWSSSRSAQKRGNVW